MCEPNRQYPRNGNIGDKTIVRCSKRHSPVDLVAHALAVDAAEQDVPQVGPHSLLPQHVVPEQDQAQVVHVLQLVLLQTQLDQQI